MPGAIHATTQELVRVTNEGCINAQSVCELRTKVAAQSLGMPVTVVLDNAPYQRCQMVRDRAAALHIELLFLVTVHGPKIL